MPPSNVLHLPARHVPRPGATRPACSSREAGRTPSLNIVERDEDYVFLCSEDGFQPVPTTIGEASGDAIARLMRQRPEAFDQWAERQREDDRNGAMIVATYVFAAFLLGVCIYAVIALVPALQILFGQAN